ncbi:hypothetical protein [Bartonella tribocorum]|nr:hypothetical protein [Bartonella tribocorum]
MFIKERIRQKVGAWGWREGVWSWSVARIVVLWGGENHGFGS